MFGARSFRAVTRPASGRIEIVAGQQRSPTPAEMVALARIENGCAAVTRALEMREEHNDQSIVGSGSLMRARTLLALGVGVFAVAVVSSPIDAQRAGAFRGSTDDPAINYATAPVNNLVEDVNRQLQAGALGSRSRAAPAICARRSRRCRFPSIRSCWSSHGRVCRANKSANRIPAPSSSTTASRSAGCAAATSSRWRRMTSALASCSIRSINALRLRTHRSSSGPSSVLAVTWPAIRSACPAS